MTYFFVFCNILFIKEINNLSPMAKNLVTLDLDNTLYEFRPYGTCSTAAATAAKSVAISNFTLCTGATVIVKFTTTNTATNPTLNVNSTGAKSLNLNNIKLIANNTYEFRYNGSTWDCISISDIPKATKNNIGGIKSANDRTAASNLLSGPINTGGTTATRYYGIETTSDGIGFVNVPWTDTDTTYNFGTGLQLVGDFPAVQVDCDKKTLFAGSLTNINQAEATSVALQLGQDHEWKNTGSNLSNLNTFVEYGVYNIFGDHTRNDDNLPIMNTGSGHTFQGRLLVYNSSLPNTGNASNDCCITQVLTLSNRVGGDGNTYIRTGVGSTSSSLTWGTWGKLQTNIEVGQIPEQCLELLIDNGIYSGVIAYNNSKTGAVIKYNNAYFCHTETNKVGSTYTFTFSYNSGNPNMNGYSLSYSSLISNPQGVAIPASIVLSGSTGNTTITSGFEVYTYLNNYAAPLLTTVSDPAITFVLITVNGYAAASQVGVPTQYTQLLYGISVGGTSVAKKRIGVKAGDEFYFEPWEDLGGTNIPVASNNTLGGIKLGYTQTGKNYPVVLDGNSKAYVNVPWTNENTNYAKKLNVATSVSSNKLLKNTTYVLTNQTINVNDIEEPANGEVATYNLILKNCDIQFNKKIYWYNGIKPENTNILFIEVVITGVKTGSTTIYTATFGTYTEI